MTAEEQMLKTIKIKLEFEGYGGLHCEGECGCDLEYLAPCGSAEKEGEDDNWINGCQPGYKHVDPRSPHGGWIISGKKEPPTAEKFDEVFASC